MNDELISKPERLYWGTGCILIDNNYNILVLQRKDNLLWGTPGGTVEDGETALQAIKREFQEEVGLDLIDPKFIGITYSFNEDIIWKSFVFICTNYTGSIKIQEDEVIQCKWLPLDTIDKLELFNPFNESLYLLDQVMPEFLNPVNEIRKITAMERDLTIHNHGSNGGNGHYDNTGKWVYDKAPKKDSPKIIPPQQNKTPNNSNQVTKLKNSFIAHFSNTTDIKKLYQVKDGKFIFPDCKSAMEQGIVKDKKSYLTLFKEQYVLYALLK